MEEKDTGPIVKPEGDVDGDNLILENPGRVTKKLPDIKFDKMLGRPEKVKFYLNLFICVEFKRK